MMRKTKTVVACVLALVLAGGLQACSHQAGESNPANNSTASGKHATAPGNLAIASDGPHQTKAGVPFNVQPSGSAAIWFHMNQPLNGYKVWVDFNGTLLAAGSVSGNLVTAGVPAKLYAESGTYASRVVARKGAVTRRSDAVQFMVN